MENLFIVNPAIQPTSAVPARLAGSAAPTSAKMAEDLRAELADAIQVRRDAEAAARAAAEVAARAQIAKG
jgi:hypothetical protein